MTEIQLKSILDKLSIPYTGNINSKGWLYIICPFHDDEHFGSASVRESGVISCFVCGSHNLFKAVKLKHPDMETKDIFAFLQTYQNKNLEIVLQERLEKRQRQQTAEKVFRINYKTLDLQEVDLDWYYCKTRKFTKDWLDKHNIKYVSSGFYEGYFCIPLVFQGKNISYEFRKAVEYERLKELYQCRGDLEFLRSKFKKDPDNKKYKWSEYLLRPKTLYPKGNIEYKNTLFNYDNCDLSQDVYICEGVAGTAEVEGNVVSTYGSKLNPKQIELLRNFKFKKFVINDGDEAADSYIWSLCSQVENVYIYPENVLGSEYLIKKSGILDINFF